MKEQNTNQMSTRQVIEVHHRAIGDMQKMCPYLLPSTALYAVVSGIVPYVTVFFSARILNELAGQRRPEELWRWVILSVAVGGVLALLNAVLLRVKSAQRDLFYDSKERLYTAKVYFQTADLFAWTVTIVAVSVVFERLFLALVDRLMGKAWL